MSRSRFFDSEQCVRNMDHLESGALTADELLTMMIFGLSGKAPSLRDIYDMNAAAWLGARVHVVTYEDLVRHVGAPDTAEADSFFAALLGACGIDRPDDWRERIYIGADRKPSGTARENLHGVGIDLTAAPGPPPRALELGRDTGGDRMWQE